jgi:hypothetical protein
MRPYLYCLPYLFLSVSSPPIRAQLIERAGHTIVCFNIDSVALTFQSPPSRFLDGQAEQFAEFLINFRDVPPAAREAITYAAGIWASSLYSDVPIRIDVSWDSLEATALASAGPGTLYRSFPGALNPETWYPVALAEAISGEELNDTTDADIVVTVNRNANWYFRLDGRTPRTAFDLVSVILHELGHGLGFLSSATEEPEGQGALGFDDFLAVYDVFLENASGQRLGNRVLFASPSVQLLRQFTSNRLFFASTMAAAFNGGEFPQVFAPTEFDEGSSLSHLDEFSFRAGSPASLMTPRLARAEAIHDPGEITLAIMEQLGWQTVLDFTGTRPALAERSLPAFPNPTAGPLSVDLPAPGPLLVRVADYTGKTLLNREVDSATAGATLRLDLSQLAPGTYLVLLSSAGEVFRARVVKQ